MLSVGDNSRLATANVAINVVEKNMNLMTNGVNDIIVNGGQYTVTSYVQNGQVINANIFSGTSTKALGNLIYFNIR